MANYDSSIADTPLPPTIQVEIDARQNSSGLSPLNYFEQDWATFTNVQFSVTSVNSARVDNHNAEVIVYTVNNDPNPQITYVVARGETIFYITQTNAVNGQQAPVFMQMVASFTVSPCPNCWLHQ